ARRQAWPLAREQKRSWCSFICALYSQYSVGRIRSLLQNATVSKASRTNQNVATDLI
ncbi:unnamed protein product, partial [Prunus brigantina]